MSKKQIFFTLIFLLTFIISLFIKQIIIKYAQPYLSNLIEKNVTITKLTFFPLNVNAYIDQQDNKIQIRYIRYAPLTFKIDFNGDIQAFDKYQPLKTTTHILANVVYDKNLHIYANSKIYASNLYTHIINIDDQWTINTQINHLNIDKFKKDNDYKIANITGLIDSNITLKYFNNKIDTNLSLIHNMINIKNAKIIYDINNSTAIFDINSSKISTKNLQIYDNINIYGSFISKNNFLLKANSNLFGSNTFIKIDNDNLTLKAKNLKLKKVLKSLKQKTNLNANLDLYAYGNKQKFSFNLSSKDILKNELLKIKGNLNFGKKLELNASSSNLSSNTRLHINGKSISFQSTNLDIQKLASELNIAQTINGHLSLQINGNTDKLKIKIKSSDFKSNYKYASLNQKTFISLNALYTQKDIQINSYIKNKSILIKNLKTTYNIKKNLLINKGNIKLYYDEYTKKLQIDTTTKLEKPFFTKAKITQDKDMINIKSFSYIDGDIISSFDINIKELSTYKALTGIDLYGNLKISGDYTDALNINSQSFGGNLDIKFKNKKLNIYLTNLQLKKVLTIIQKGDKVDNGLLNGSIDYDLDKHFGKTNIDIKDTTLNGIDLDKILSNIKNTMGLNIFKLGQDTIHNYKKNNKSTDIKHLQFNTTLKNQVLHLNDTALSTKKFRIVAFGDINQTGEINKLDIHIINIQGCSILQQDFKGNIKDPKLKSTTSAVFDIAQEIPSSLLNTTQNILEFGTKIVDKTATYTIQKTRLTDKNISITSDTIHFGANTIKKTSNMVGLKQCKIIYDGKVKAP